MSEGHDPRQQATAGGTESDGSSQATTRRVDSPSPDAPTARLGSQAAPATLDGELPIGGILADRYQVLERISAGGMGVVYKAKHLALDDIVAVKLLLKPQDEIDRKRFLLEARLATKIKHANTVYVSDFGILPDGRSYLVMEFMRGQMLSAALKSGRMESLRVCRIGLQIARGLQAVHDQNIVHRDLKPDNIFLLTQDGQPDFVKIVDFGIAKASHIPASVALELAPPAPLALEGMSATGGETARLTGQLMEMTKSAGNMTMKSAILGTPQYMSPEAIKGKAVDGRADQYSLGCVLFQLLTGHLPFREDDLMALLTQHMYEPIPELRQEVPAVPDSVAQIVSKLLAKKPEDRFASMRAVEQALEREIELIMVQRGERAVISSALAGLLKVQGKGLGAVVMIAGRAVPLWAMAPVALLLVVGGAGLGVRFLAPKIVREALRQGELRELRGRALAVLRGDLKSAPEPLRITAAAALGQSHDRELRLDLEELLGSSNATLRGQAAEALGQLGDRQSLPVLVKLLEQEQPPTARLGAALALQQLGDPRGAAELERLLARGSAEVQLRAALAGCDRLAEQGRKVLTAFLARPDLPGSPRLSILACLARVGDAEAVAALRTQAQHAERPAERIAAQVKLAELGDLTAGESLQKLIRQRGPNHLLAARLLAGPDERSGREAFRSVLGDRGAQPAARRLGAEGLAAIGELYDVRVLGSQLTEPGLSAELRQIFAAAILLISVHDPALMGEDGLAWASAELGDGDWLARQAAVAVLGDTRGEKARKLLAQALKDADRRVRTAAARALGRQLDREALELLRIGLDDQDAMVRAETLRSLSRIAKQLYRSGATELLPLLQSWVQPLLGRATDAEKVLALGLFFSLGAKERLPELMKLARAPEPETRKLLVEQLASQKEPLSQLLRDDDPAVRTLVAVRLGALGDDRAVPVLKESIGRGGTGALTALGMLTRLRQRATSPQELLALLDNASEQDRLAAVAAAAELPPELALVLLQRSARDPDAQVRQHTAEAASELPARQGQPLGWSILQILVTDKEAAVRMRARALLATLTPRTELAQPIPVRARGTDRTGSGSVVPTETGVSAATPSPVDLGAAPLGAAPVDLLASAELTPPAPATATAPAPEEPEERGQLVLEGPAFIEVQVDDQKWQALSPNPIHLTVGEHKITTLAESKTVVIRVNKTTRLELKASGIETGARDGIELYNKQQYDKALRLLERSYSACEKAKGRQQKGCGSLLAEVAYYKGSIFEAQDRLDAAATEYQRVTDSQTHGGQVESYRASAKQSLDKLTQRLGLIVFRQTTRKGCQEEKLWVQPGNPVVRLGDEEHTVRIRARQTIDLGACQ